MGHGKECSRKLNQRGHQWSMHTTKEAHERSVDLHRFCHLVAEDREQNDERIEHDRIAELEVEEAREDAQEAEGNVSLSLLTGGLSFEEF